MLSPLLGEVHEFSEEVQTGTEHSQGKIRTFPHLKIRVYDTKVILPYKPSNLLCCLYKHSILTDWYNKWLYILTCLCIV